VNVLRNERALLFEATCHIYAKSPFALARVC
jgi:hypothetical protein